MTDLRARLAAVAAIAGIVVASCGAVFAQDRHPACAAKQHDCGTPATIASCCCGDQAVPSPTAMPARARVDVSPDQAIAPPPLASAAAPLVPLVTITAAASPPGWCLLDRPALFGVLLI